MLDLYKNIRTLRKRAGMTQGDLAEKAGYTSRSSITKIERGEVDLPQSKISMFANIFHVSETALMGPPEKLFASKIKMPENLLPVPETKQIPLLGEISCGKPVYADQEHEYVETDLKADFCLRASGDSMVGARIYDGDLVYCRLQEDVNNGEIAVVIIDDAATLKRFYNYGNTVVLRPENPKYQEQVYSGDQLNQIRVLGKAIAFRAPIV